MIALIKQFRFFYLKKLKWRKYTIGKNMYVGRRVYLWAKEKITIGDNFYIGRDSQIETDCIIGDNVIFANKVAIVGKYDHHYQKLGWPIRLAPRIRNKHYSWKGLNQITVIEDDVWIGYGAIIMSGVKIQKGCIIAAGSVITKDTEPYQIYGGNPAKKIAPRFESQEDLKNHIALEKEILKKHQNYKGVKSLK
ncbi:Maltose O-acetyltransferase [hydrothermal vent metagenome]|uniref:Maltose O-acetyltransferase n=1 Tax=hydrothermal vent metagenome TaxID=652676 RepID=A0A3B0THJ2_9ZZZZ